MDATHWFKSLCWCFIAALEALRRSERKLQSSPAPW